jgi:putative redox protein
MLGMNLTCAWKEKMAFVAATGGNEVEMDTKLPLGDDRALTPKELVLAGLCGCTAMDVIALLKKHKQSVDSFEIDAQAPTAEEHPLVFKEVRLTFKLIGTIDKERALEAVRLSQTKYCAVSAMLMKAVPISYSVEINGEVIGSGEARAA